MPCADGTRSVAATVPDRESLHPVAGRGGRDLGKCSWSALNHACAMDGITALARRGGYTASACEDQAEAACWIGRRCALADRGSTSHSPGRYRLSDLDVKLRSEGSLAKENRWPHGCSSEQDVAVVSEVPCRRATRTSHNHSRTWASRTLIFTGASCSPSRGRRSGSSCICGRRT